MSARMVNNNIQNGTVLVLKIESKMRPSLLMRGLSPSPPKPVDAKIVRYSRNDEKGQALEMGGRKSQLLPEIQNIIL